jgi:hypothetical protein
MKLSISQAMYKEESRQMIGWLVQQVDYTEVDYYPAHPQPCYATDHPQIHTVDFSIRLRFTNQQSVEISWKNFEGQDTENNTYGLNISTGTTAQQSLAGQRTWDVSGENPWLDLIGQAVKDIKVYWTKAWSEIPEETKTSALQYPQAIALSFTNQKTIFISIAEFQAGNLHKVVRGANNLLVTTDESLAKQTNMLSEEATAI